MANPVLTPAAVALFALTAQLAPASILITADQDITAWTATAGAVVAVDARHANYTPPNITGGYTVTGRNAALEAGISAVTVTGVAPLNVSWPNNFEIDKQVVVSDSRTKRRAGRVLDDGELWYGVDASHLNVPRLKAAAFITFYANHYPEKPFAFSHAYLQLNNMLFLFDGKISGSSGHVIGQLSVPIVRYLA